MLTLVQACNGFYRTPECQTTTKVSTMAALPTCWQQYGTVTSTRRWKGRDLIALF